MSQHHENNFIVRIEGGLGAQIIALSAYYYLKSIACNVIADISYFDNPLRYAKPGEKRVTHWDWQINNYGLNFDSFDWINLNKIAPYFKNTLSDPKEGIQILHLKEALENYKIDKKKDFKDYNFFSDKNYNLKSINNFFTGPPVYIKDGPNKSKLYHAAMKDENIRNKFLSNSTKWRDILNKKNIKLDNSIFVHLRRGDYLNIKQFNIISEDDVFNIIKKLPNIFTNVVILSDADENKDFTKRLEEKFQKVYWMNNIDSFNTHMILRKAKFLICSNSQFSNTAAYLGESFSIIPQRHVSDKDYIFQYENNITSFALLNN